MCDNSGASADQIAERREGRVVEVRGRVRFAVHSGVDEGLGGDGVAHGGGRRPDPPRGAARGEAPAAAGLALGDGVWRLGGPLAEGGGEDVAVDLRDAADVRGGDGDADGVDVDERRVEHGLLEEGPDRVGEGDLELDAGVHVVDDEKMVRAVVEGLEALAEDDAESRLQHGLLRDGHLLRELKVGFGEDVELLKRGNDLGIVRDDGNLLRAFAVVIVGVSLN